LTDFSEKKRGPGRPEEIGDNALGRALAELNFVLEQNWALIGWELQRAKTIPDIRAAFKEIVGFNCAQLEPYRYEPTQRTTSKELRHLRRELADAHEQSRTRANVLTETRRSAESASLTEAVESSATVAAVQASRSQLTKAYEEARVAFEASQVHSMELLARLYQQEAHFVQSQLLEFTQSNRRRFQPLSIAMAMAGMPRLSARVSCERCSRLKDNVQPGLTYQMFQAVAAVFARPGATVSEASDSMKAYLLESGRKSQIHITELRRNWHFLGLAIETVCRAGPHPRGALPYRTFAEYQRRFECQNQAQVLLAEKNQLQANKNAPSPERFIVAGASILYDESSLTSSRVIARPPALLPFGAKSARDR
jgi:hypothetical protein